MEILKIFFSLTDVPYISIPLCPGEGSPGTEDAGSKEIHMRKLFWILIVILFQLEASNAIAGQADKKALTVKIMEQSGMNEQIRQIPLVYSSVLSQNRSKIPPDSYSTLERETIKLFDPEKILKEMSRQIEKNLDMKAMQDVLAWLESDPGQKITAMEKDSSTPEGVKAMQESAGQAGQTPLSQKRLELVERFIRATKTVETSVDMLMSVNLAIATAHNAVLPVEKRKDPGEIKTLIEPERPKLQEKARKNAITNNLTIYKTLKDEEFQRYVEFAESSSGKRYHEVTSGAMKESMQRICVELGKKMAALVKKLSVKGGRSATGKVLIRLKSGKTLRWNSYTEKGNQYCTWLASGEFCINKRDVASIEAE